MLSLKDLENYRFYQCVIKPSGYDCYKIKDSNYKILENSQLITINKNLPNIDFLEKKILKYKLIPSQISIKN